MDSYILHIFLSIHDKPFMQKSFAIQFKNPLAEFSAKGSIFLLQTIV